MDPSASHGVDYDDDLMDEGCHECGGEGFVSDCVEEWACVDPEYGCDYCTRRCPLCNPPKRDPAQGTSASGQDPQGLEAKPAGPVLQGCAPTPSATQVQP